MQTLKLLFIGTVLIYSCQPASPKEDIVSTEEATQGFDSLLAVETGADDYGMRQYVFAYLKKGPNRDYDSAKTAEIQRAHLHNITRLAEEGKLVLAGPFMDETEIRGIYVFAVESLEEAEALINSDPAIQSGSLIMELHPWYGSAALMKITELHGKLAKIISKEF